MGWLRFFNLILSPYLLLCSFILWNNLNFMHANCPPVHIKLKIKAFLFCSSCFAGATSFFFRLSLYYFFSLSLLKELFSLMWLLLSIITAHSSYNETIKWRSGNLSVWTGINFISLLTGSSVILTNTILYSN